MTHWKWKLALCLVIVSGGTFTASIFATIFRPLPIEEQIRNSSAVIQAKYVGKNFKKTQDDEIVTELTFSIVKSAGLKSSDVTNRNSFKITAPGGVWQGVVYQVHGTPTFEDGEEAILLINSSPQGYFLSNMALSKYSLVQDKSRILLKSSVFPYHPNLGQIPYEDFDKLVSQKFGYFEKDFRKFSAKKIIEEEAKNKNGRSVASTYGSGSDDDDGKISMFWMVVLLGLLGTYPTYYYRSKK